MTTHTPECERYLAELLSAPIDSIDHRMAAAIKTLPLAEARDFVITVLNDDPAGSRPFDIAARMWPLLTDEVSE